MPKSVSKIVGLQLTLHSAHIYMPSQKQQDLEPRPSSTLARELPKSTLKSKEDAMENVIYRIPKDMAR